jgi:hypothetical protein
MASIRRACWFRRACGRSLLQGLIQSPAGVKICRELYEAGVHETASGASGFARCRR